MQFLPARSLASTGGAGAGPTACQAAVVQSLAQAHGCDFPYPHWLLTGLLPLDLAWALAGLPFAEPPGLDGLSRGPTSHLRVLMPDEVTAFAPCRAVAETFQSPAIVGLISRAIGCDLRDCGLRIGLEHDVDGYDCPPRTRQGEARFTLMVALDAHGQRHLGPDIYFDSGAWAAQAPWRPGCALAFAPSERSWHGFEPRMIRSVRTSLVIDYVAPAQFGGAALTVPYRALGRASG